MHVAKVIPLLVLGTLAVLEPAHAAKNDPNIALSFVPQQTVAGATVTVPPAMLDQPVQLTVIDARRDPDPALLGTRTDDDDRMHALRATGDTIAFIRTSLQQMGELWGLRFAPQAERTLELSVVTFQVQETNQAVGATFRAEARLAAELHTAGVRLWSGATTGDATRYGRKFSNANCNEVLSDALLESFAALVSEPGLHEAWAGRQLLRPAVPIATEESASISPHELLGELLTLMERGFEIETLEHFVQQQTLSEPLTAGDLARWQESGIPEKVIRAALARPVR